MKKRGIVENLVLFWVVTNMIALPLSAFDNSPKEKTGFVSLSTLDSNGFAKITRIEREDLAVFEEKMDTALAFNPNIFFLFVYFLMAGVMIVSIAKKNYSVVFVLGLGIVLIGVSSNIVSANVKNICDDVDDSPKCNSNWGCFVQNEYICNSDYFGGTCRRDDNHCVYSDGFKDCLGYLDTPELYYNIGGICRGDQEEEGSKTDALVTENGAGSTMCVSPRALVAGMDSDTKSKGYLCPLANKAKPYCTRYLKDHCVDPDVGRRECEQVAQTYDTNMNFKWDAVNNKCVGDDGEIWDSTANIGCYVGESRCSCSKIENQWKVSFVNTKNPSPVVSASDNALMVEYDKFVSNETGLGCYPQNLPADKNDVLPPFYTFDLMTIYKAETYFFLEQNKTLNLTIIHDNEYELHVLNKTGAVIKTFKEAGLVVGEDEQSISLKKGIYRIIFYVHNMGGTGRMGISFDRAVKNSVTWIKTEIPSSETECNNGIDDDGDGLTDMNDDDCFNITDSSGTDQCPSDSYKGPFSSPGDRNLQPSAFSGADGCCGDDVLFSEYLDDWKTVEECTGTFDCTGITNATDCIGGCNKRDSGDVCTGENSDNCRSFNQENCDQSCFYDTSVDECINKDCYSFTYEECSTVPGCFYNGCSGTGNCSSIPIDKCGIGNFLSCSLSNSEINFEFDGTSCLKFEDEGAKYVYKKLNLTSKKYILSAEVNTADLSLGSVLIDLNESFDKPSKGFINVSNGSESKTYSYYGEFSGLLNLRILCKDCSGTAEIKNIQLIQAGDYGYINSNSTFLCDKNEGWNWSFSEIDPFKIKKIGDQDLVSNYEEWFVCNATSDSLEYGDLNKSNYVGNLKNLPGPNSLPEGNCICYTVKPNSVNCRDTSGENKNKNCWDQIASGSPTQWCGDPVLPGKTPNMPKTLQDCGIYRDENGNPEQIEGTGISTDGFLDTGQAFNKNLRKTVGYNVGLNCSANMGTECNYNENNTCTGENVVAAITKSIAVGYKCCISLTGGEKNCSKIDEKNCSDMHYFKCSSSEMCVGKRFASADSDENNQCCESQRECKPKDLDNFVGDAIFNRSSAILCYQENQKNYFAECCSSTICSNKNLGALSEFSDINTFGIGSPIHTIYNFDQTINNSFRTRVKWLRKSFSNFINPIDTFEFGNTNFDFVKKQKSNWSEFDYLNFKIWFANTTGINLTVYFVDGTQHNYSLKEYSTNGFQTDIWHNIKINISEIKNKEMNFMSLQVKKPEGPADVDIYLDNFYLSTETKNNNPLATMYCAAPFGKWISDVENNSITNFKSENFNEWGPYKYVCNYQLAYSWTGQKCCGDGQTNEYDEAYNDTAGGCFYGCAVFDDEKVIDVCGPMAKNETKLIFINNTFQQCGKGSTYGEFKSLPNSFCKVQKSWFCSYKSEQWLNISEPIYGSGDVFKTSNAPWLNDEEYPTECCSNGACWNGKECIANLDVEERTAQNLVSNSNFEDWENGVPVNWTNLTSVDENDYYDEFAHSLKFNITGNATILESNSFKLRKNVNYIVTGYFKNISGEGNITLRVNNNFTIFTGVLSGFKNESFNFNSTNTISANITIEANATGYYYGLIDNISIVESDLVNENIIYVCKNSTWSDGFKIADRKYDWNEKIYSFCFNKSQCYISPNAYPQIGYLENKIDSRNCTTENFIFIENNYCMNGTWTTRTALLASILINITNGANAQSNYTLFCDNSTNVFNKGEEYKLPYEGCVLEYYSGNRNIIVGGVVNDSTKLYTLHDDLTKTFNISSTLNCSDAYNSNEKSFIECDDVKVSGNTYYLYYNNYTKLIIFSRESIEFSTSTWQKLWNVLKHPFDNVMSLTTKLFKSPSILTPKVDYFNQLYQSEKEGKIVYGVVKNKTNDKYWIVSYENFSTDMCSAANNKSLDYLIKNNLNCTTSDPNYTLVLMKNLAYWPDVSAMLRIQKYECGNNANASSGMCKCKENYLDCDNDDGDGIGWTGYGKNGCEKTEESTIQNVNDNCGKCGYNCETKKCVRGECI